MKVSKTLKTLLIILAVVALAMVALFVLNKPKTDQEITEGLVTTTASGDVVDAGTLASQSATSERVNDLVVLLRSVTSIELSDDVFTSPVYAVLRDFSQPISRDANPGRLNPFMPIGFESPTNNTAGVPDENNGLTIVDLGDNGDLDLFLDDTEDANEGIQTDTIQ